MNIKDVDNNNTWRCRKVEWKHLIRGSLRTRKYLLTTLITSGIILLFINIFAADEDYVSSSELHDIDTNLLHTKVIIISI